MSSNRSRIKLTLIVGTAVLLLNVSGCHSFNTGIPSLNTFLSGTMLPNAQQQAEDQPVAYCFVELHPAYGRPVRRQVPLNGSTTVREALQQTGAIKRFRKLEIDVIRDVDGRGKKAKMGVEYSALKREIASHTDYVLHPGDRVVVKENLSNFLSEMLGPFGKFIER